MVRMRDALEQADRTIAVFSEAYLASGYSTDEWTGAFLDDESGQERLLPVRVEACALPRLLATRIYIDLVGASRPTAKQRLLEGVKRGRRRPDREPPGPWGVTGGLYAGNRRSRAFPHRGQASPTYRGATSTSLAEPSCWRACIAPCSRALAPR